LQSLHCKGVTAKVVIRLGLGVVTRREKAPGGWLGACFDV
jgi:hypothetical protein